MRTKTEPARPPAGEERPHPVRNTLLYLLATVAVFLALMLATNRDAAYVESAAGLEGFDYTARIAYVGPTCFDWYPKALYTPEDFAAGRVAAQPRMDDGGSLYYTYRLLLPLQEGEVYGLSGYSATHAQTVWVDGALLSAVGSPGDSAQTMSAKSNYYTVYFTAGAGLTEIVIQRSSFVHANGGQLTPLYLGRQALITRMNGRAMVGISAVLGCMLMAALFFLGMYIFHRERRDFLWFSLSCLLIILRTITVDYKLIMLLLPDLNWELALKLEYISTLLFPLFLALYVNAVFEHRLDRRVNTAGLIVCLAYCLLILCTPAIVYTRVKLAFQLGIELFALAISAQLVWLVVRKGQRRLDQWLIMLGTIAYMGISLADMLLHSTGGHYDNVNFSKTGMVLFVCLNTLALALNLQRVEQALSQAQRSQRELDEANRLLVRLNSMKTDFLANISHEMKTPLTIIGGYAQLADWHLEAGTADEGTRENLRTIAHESERLGHMVDRLLQVSAMKDGALEKGPVPAGEILRRAAAVSAPILQKNGNRIELSVEEGCPAVLANGDVILQVLLNLLSNAGRHTSGDTVRLCARGLGNTVEFRVEDHGDGIAPELLGDIFRREVSGDGGTGIGLSICKGAVEDHGGTIAIESALGEGTTIRFTLPAAQDGTP